MRSWSSTLDRAAVDTPSLRADFSEQRKRVAERSRAEYMAARLLLPTSLLPDVVAVVAFMHDSDDLLDRALPGEGISRLASWEEQTREALQSGDSPDSTLRCLVSACGRHPGLRDRVESFLRGAAVEASWVGFGSEAEYKEYVAAYSLPAFMLSACLLRQGSEDAAAYEGHCHELIDAMQRIDFLSDLAEDVASGRLGISLETLDCHGLAPEDLKRGLSPDSSALDQLVRQQVERAEESLAAARGLTTMVNPDCGPFVSALFEVQELRAHAVRRAGALVLVAPPDISGLRLARLLIKYLAKAIWKRAATAGGQ
ncbi:squalene/phytoene synthase family protein [Streptomyces solicathayae]|uniref:Squalene/phytoene synthase family protein n=1 Tax=Streptomyces solicathayae TaxID=3081768 RepID=A0ABZ0LL04_9ACTN|nr:squalene/phytoene synthase family protein [Streptomyces sp. HUAS YS2]WOX19935.1 squalene/phytoene synthase family protein [Streptomyces sp. HUAS YS2]